MGTIQAVVGKFPRVGVGRRRVGAGDLGSRAVVKCLSLANGRRQLPLVIWEPGTGDGARAPLARPAAPVAMSGAPVAKKGERRLQLRNSASPGRDPNPRPLAQAPTQRLPSEEGRGWYSLGEAGRRERGGRIPRPGRSEQEPAQARRRPPRRLGPRQPAARPPPRWPHVPARPPRARARPGACAHARDPGSSEPAPLLSLRALARGAPDSATAPLLGASAARRLFASAVVSLPTARAGPRSIPHGLRSLPRDPLGLSLFSRRNRGPPPPLCPSFPAPSHLITPSTHSGPSTAFARM